MAKFSKATKNELSFPLSLSICLSLSLIHYICVFIEALESTQLVLVFQIID